MDYILQDELGSPQGTETIQVGDHVRTTTPDFGEYLANQALKSASGEPSEIQKNTRWIWWEKISTDWRSLTVWKTESGVIGFSRCSVLEKHPRANSF